MVRVKEDFIMPTVIGARWTNRARVTGGEAPDFGGFEANPQSVSHCLLAQAIPRWKE